MDLRNKSKVFELIFKMVLAIELGSRLSVVCYQLSVASYRLSEKYDSINPEGMIS